MDIFGFLRAYWPSLLALVMSTLAMILLLPLKDSAQTIGIFLVLR